MKVFKSAAEISSYGILLNKEFYEKASRFLEERARFYLNFNAGRETEMAKKIHAMSLPGQKKIVLEVNDKAAPFVEFGTHPHIIRPKNKKALAWTHEGANVTTKNGRKIVLGDKIIVKKVHHPGTPAQPFIRPTLDDFKNSFRKMF